MPAPTCPRHSGMSLNSSLACDLGEEEGAGGCESARSELGSEAELAGLLHLGLSRGAAHPTQMVKGLMWA